MSLHQIVEETAATDREINSATDQGQAAATAKQRDSRSLAGTRPGLLMAGFVVAAALTTTSPNRPFPDVYTGTRRHDTLSESETAGTECDPELVREVRELFEQGASEFFEDGMRSSFSRSLLWFLSRHGRMGFRAIAEYLGADSSNPDVVSEALRWMGDLKDSSTLLETWAVLRRSLKSSSPRVRDGAILGFAALDDPRARPLLLDTRNAEPIGELRRLIDIVIDQLDATANAPTPAHRSPEQMA